MADGRVAIADQDGGVVDDSLIAPAGFSLDKHTYDFLPVTDLLFRPLYAFFLVALGSRRVVHVGVTRHPTDAWAAQQLREATPFGEGPRFLIRDNDGKYGPCFDRIATASGSRVLRTPVRAPRANALCERFLGSVRRECLDHLPVLGEAHLRHVLRAYVAYFNHARPHQGIGQAVPAGVTTVERPGMGRGRVIAFPILGASITIIVVSRDQPAGLQRCGCVT